MIDPSDSHGNIASMPVAPPVPRPADALLEQARWRTTTAEQRGSGIRTQATALLAVIAVVGGIGATAIGTLGSRDFSSLSFKMAILHSVPGEVVPLVPLAIAALCVMVSGAITLYALRDRGDVAAQATRELMDNYALSTGGSADQVAKRLLRELALDYVRIENAANVARRGLIRASWWLGAGVTLGLVVSAILVASRGNPTQTQLVRSPQLSKSPIVVRLQH
jgi:hypothetical protein